MKRLNKSKWLVIASHMFVLFSILFSFNAFSSSFYKESRYMSLKYEEANVRSGPRKNFKIIYRYKVKGLPVIVLGKYDNWYKIKDLKSNIGWVSDHLLSKARTVITLNQKNFIYKDKKITESYPLFKADKNITLKLIKCDKDVCKVEVNKKSGWIRKTDIWGWDETLLGRIN